MDAKIPATATVLTYNSARTLEECLASLGSFADVLVLDGGSTDQTLEIARRYGARIETQQTAPGPITDFTAIRERSFRLAAYDWVLVVDSDEIADALLVAGVRDAVVRNAAVVYRVERVPRVSGALIRHAYFSPDRVLRLVRRDCAAWAPGKRVHERLVVVPGTPVADLPGMLVTPWPSPDAFAAKDRHYLHLAFRVPLTARPPIGRTVRSVIKNVAQAVRIAAYALWTSLRYGRRGGALSLRLHLRFAHYHILVARERLRQFVLGIRYVPPSS
ncbi:MAG: glycosyltransferase family 2 protein [Patescibacteria group bacterium]